MKKILVAVAVAMCSVAVYCYTQTQETGLDLLLSEVEGLALPEGGNVITCRCKSGFLTNNKCLVSNPGSTCAQSGAGGNVQCADYYGNC